MCILDGSSVSRDIYEVYWPYVVMSFTTAGGVAAKQEAALLLHLARHFATASKCLLTSNISLRVHRLQLLFQAGSVSRSIGPGLSRRPPSAGQAPLAVLRGSLGLDCVWLSCVTDVGRAL